MDPADIPRGQQPHRVSRKRPVGLAKGTKTLVVGHLPSRPFIGTWRRSLAIRKSAPALNDKVAFWPRSAYLRPVYTQSSATPLRATAPCANTARKGYNPLTPTNRPVA